MKNSLGRRWLALFLTVAVCLTLAPAVFAVDPGQDTLQSISVTVNDISLAPGESKTPTFTVTAVYDTGSVEVAADA